jgi:MFS transporter, ACS family, glucarate transporter
MEFAERPTRARYRVVAFLCGLTFILYLDRVCIGQAASFIQTELGLSDRELGLVFAAFTVAYGLFEVVTGHWGDRYGSRSVLTRIVIWWSLFTALTGTATGFFSLLAVRFLFGAGEAGALPNAARVTQTWFPPARRGAIRGLIVMPALVGSTVASPLTAYLIEAVGWRWVFGIYGLVGIGWAVAFRSWFRDHPSEHPGVNAAELALIGAAPPPSEHAPLPWRQLATNSNVWLLGVVLTTGAATVYTLFSWYPSYLQDVHGLSNEAAGWLSGLVMAGGALGCLCGGWAADWAARNWPGSRWARSGVGASGFALAALAMLIGSAWNSAVPTSYCFALACFGIHAHAGAYWGVAGDIGGRHIGALFAVINSIGQFGAAAAQALFGCIPRSEWGHAFGACGLLLIAGAFCWSQVDGRRTLSDGA